MRPESDLRQTQHEIADAIYEHDAQMVIAGMGAGKTCAALTAIDALIEDDIIDHALVVAPPHTLLNAWDREPLKWRHLCHLQHDTLLGGPEKRARAWSRFRELDYLTISLHLCQALENELPTDLGRCMLLIDEPSFFKDARSKNGAALRRIAGRFQIRAAMTGTPRPNSYEDLWGPFQILSDSQLFEPFDKWRRRNFMPEDPKGYRWSVHDFRARQIDETLAPYITSVDVELDLPDLNIGADFDIEVTLPGEARERYREMEDRLITEVTPDLRAFLREAEDRSIHLTEEELENQIVAAMSQAVCSGKLSQIAQGYLYDEGEALGSIHMEKRDALRDMLRECGGDPVMIWYGYRHDLDLIRSACGVKELPTLGNATAAKKAQKHIDRFGAGELPFLAAHPASAAHGIDGLQMGGRRHIWFCPPWSAEQYDQAIKRLHRPGQERAVFSHRIIARDTVDEVKRWRVEGKIAEQQGWSRLVREIRSNL